MAIAWNASESMDARVGAGSGDRTEAPPEKLLRCGSEKLLSGKRAGN